MDSVPYTSGEGKVLAFPESASLRRVSTSGEQIEEGCLFMRCFVYLGSFVGRGMLEAYARVARKGFTDAGKNLTDLPTLDERVALMAEEDEVAAVGAPTADDGALQDSVEDDDW